MEGKSSKVQSIILGDQPEVNAILGRNYLGPEGGRPLADGVAGLRNLRGMPNDPVDP